MAAASTLAILMEDGAIALEAAKNDVLVSMEWTKCEVYNSRDLVWT